MRYRQLIKSAQRAWRNLKGAVHKKDCRTDSSKFNTDLNGKQNAPIAMLKIFDFVESGSMDGRKVRLVCSQGFCVKFCIF